MFINGIVAVNCKHSIGLNGKIPWHISEELAFFKRTTLHSICVMGRVTYESLPYPLADRINIVLTKSYNWKHGYTGKEEVVVHSGAMVDSVESFDNIYLYLERLQSVTKLPIFIIGGLQIYTLFQRFIQRWYVSLIDNMVQGDVVYPYPFSEEFNSAYFLSRCLVRHDRFTAWQYDKIL